MFDRLVVPTDGSEPAVAALRHAATLARYTGATGHVLYVDGAAGDDPIAEHVLDEGSEWFAEADATVTTDRRSGPVAETILEYTSEVGGDAIVLGTHGREGLERLVVGSVTESVVRNADVPVLVVPPSGTASQVPYGTVVVGTDGSDHATACVHRAATIAAATDATLHVLSVVDVTPVGIDERSDVRVEAFKRVAEDVAEDAADVARAAGVDRVVTAVRVGAADRELRSYAASFDADLLAVGTHGRRGVDRLLLGSVSERLLRSAPVPVLTVRGDD